MNEPVICFGQQPSGFFPKRFLIAKINTARALQKEVGGKVVFFYHDSDADYRETITLMRDKNTGVEVRLNFTQENKLQKKFSPLYLKRIPGGWKEEILKQLPRFVEKEVANVFQSVNQKTASEFCLEMYQKMGLLDGVDILRSSDVNFREKALDLDKDYFADVQYMGEVVRAQFIDSKFKLHEGGGKYVEVPAPEKIEKRQKSPGADQRFGWMNSVIGSTHYIYGEGEAQYLKFTDFPNVQFVKREKIDNPNYAWTETL